MTLQPYVDTYQTYRDSTRRITSWLVGTASRCGADIGSLALEVVFSEITSNRSSTSSAVSRKKNIPIDRYVGLAKAIKASNGPNVSFPEDITILIHDVIGLRREAGDFFAKCRKAHQKTTDNAQSHFVSVLEEVLDVLQSQAHAGGLDVPVSTPQTPITTVDYPCAQQNEAPNGVTPTTSTCDLSGTIEYDIDISAEEVSFAIYALFKDFHAIREYLQSVWLDYHAGKLDAMTAAVVTDTAFTFLKQSWEDMSAEIGIVDYSTLINILKDHIDGADDPTTEFLDWICYDTMQVLQDYVKLLQVNPMPVPIPGAWGIYDSKQDRSKLCRQEQYTEDLVLLMELLPEFSYLARARLDFPTQDLLTVALKEMMKGRQLEDLPVYGLLACQILLDIHHGLRDQAAKPFRDLRATAKRTVASIDDFFRFSEGKTNQLWTPEHNEMLMQVRDFAIYWALADPVGHIRRGSMYGMKPRRFYLLKNHPILSGLLIFRLNLVMNDVGITICNAWGSVAQAGHLYKCARLNGGLGMIWDDMEFLLDIHTYQRDSKSWPICHGTFAAEIRSGLETTNTDPAGHISTGQNELFRLGTSSPVKDIFRNRYVEDGRLDLSLPNIASMITVTRKSKLQNGSRADIERSFIKMFKDQSHVNGIQLLDILKAGISSENIHLLFDFFALHQCASTLLEDVQTHLPGDTVQHHDSARMQDGVHVPAEHDYRLGAMAEVDPEVVCDQLKETSKIFAAFLQAGEGVKCMTAAKKVANG